MARALMIFIAILVACSAVPVPQRKNKGSLAADDAFEAALAEAAHELAAVPEAAPAAAPEVAQEAAQVAALAKEVAPAAEQEAAPAAAATNETHVVCPSKTCTSASNCPKLLGSARCVCGRCVTLSSPGECPSGGITYETCTVSPGYISHCNPPAGGFKCPASLTTTTEVTTNVISSGNSSTTTSGGSSSTVYSTGSDATSTAVGVTAAALVVAACAVLL